MKNMGSRRDLLKLTGLLGISTGASALTPSLASAADKTSHQPSSPEFYGAMGDGITDDTKAMQHAFNQQQAIYLTAGKVYLVSELTIPPTKNWRLIGNGATIRKINLKGGINKKPLMASLAYRSNKARAQPAIVISDVQLEGNSGCDQVLVLQNWNSEVVNCDISGALKAGLLLSSDTENGSKINSSMVNNRIINCRIHHNNGYGILVQDSSRNKVTDGLIDNCYLYDNNTFAIRLNSGAGWNINNTNIYANGGGITLDTAGKGTRINNCFIDTGKKISSKRNNPYLSIFVANHIKVGFVKFSGNHINGAVATLAKGDSKQKGLISQGNIYFGDGHLLFMRKTSKGYIFSKDDFFETQNPFRWNTTEHKGVFVVENSFNQDSLENYSGRYTPNGKQ